MAPNAVMGTLKLEPTEPKRSTSVKRVVAVVAVAFMVTGAVFAVTADTQVNSARRLQGNGAGEGAEVPEGVDPAELQANMEAAAAAPPVIHLTGDDMAILPDCSCNPAKGCVMIPGYKAFCEVDTLNCMGFDYRQTEVCTGGTCAGLVDDGTGVYSWASDDVFDVITTETDDFCKNADGTGFSGKCRSACESISGRYDCWDFPCRNKGVCIDGNSEYTCDCATGFSGKDCEVNDNECTMPKEPFCEERGTWGTLEVNGNTVPSYMVNSHNADGKCGKDEAGKQLTGTTVFPCYVAPAEKEAKDQHADCTNFFGQVDEYWGAPGTLPDGSPGSAVAMCREYFMVKTVVAGQDGQPDNTFDVPDPDCIAYAEAIDEGVEPPFVKGAGFRCSCNAGTAEDGGKGLEGNGYRRFLPKRQKKLVAVTGINADYSWQESTIVGCRDIDDCASTPCANGGTCEDDEQAWAFQCTCVKGWTGHTCEEDILECGDPNTPEENDGSLNNCVKDIEIYAPRDTLGDGKSYVDTLEDGTEKIMLKIATCIEKRGTYACMCDPGWTGDARTGIVNWRQTVQVGKPIGEEYMGCIDIDDCASIPCQHGSTCSEPDELFGTGEYNCECTFGWHGDNCEHDDNECEADKAEMREICSEYATCENTDGSYSCTCNDGWTGDGITCIDADDCEFSPCANGGTCSDLGTLKFNCECVAGWRGPICSDDWNECTMGIHTCHDSASCINNEGSFSCRCDPGYSGDGHLTCIDINDCEVYKSVIGGDPNFVCTVGECGAVAGTQLSVVIHGTCEDVGPNAFVGTCEMGWTDANCDLDVNECDPVDGEAECHNHATCINTDGSYKCECDPGFSGDGVAACTDINDCQKACSNGGACTDMGANDFRCKCQNGWTNRRCDYDINECAAFTHNCHGNANCINADGSFACKCKDGFSGDGTTDCTDIDDCASGPCDHGTCSDDGAHMYKCTCVIGWTDTNCDFDVNECYLNKHNCHVDARCVNAPGSFYCRCLSGYEGDGYSLEHIHNDYTARDMFMQRVENPGYDEAGDADALNNPKYIFNLGRDIMDEDREHVGAEEVIGMHAKGCIDLDDCSPRWGPEGQCDAEHGTCFDQGQNSFLCTCKDQPNPSWCGRYCAADCQECEIGTHTCDPHATCTNTYGSFTCECNEEFYGDGAVCAECTVCPVGYKMEGEGCGAPNKFIDRTCVNIDECLNPELNNCHELATCEDTQGSFTCTCGPEGVHWGDGVDCTSCTFCNPGNDIDNGGFEVPNVATDGYHEAAPCTVTADRICVLNVPSGVYMMESEAEGGSTAAGDKECLAFLSADAANFDGSFTFPERFNWGNGPDYCGYGQTCGDEDVAGTLVKRSPKQCLLAEGFATWKFTSLRENLYTIESNAGGEGWQCLIFGRNGNELYPSRATCEGWDAAENGGMECPYEAGMPLCGFQASGSGSALEALLAARAPVWRVIVLKQQANKFLIQSDAANPKKEGEDTWKCLSFANNGLDRNPRRYDWGNGGVFCGAGNWNNNEDEQEGQLMGILNNKQAVWVLTYLEG
jgi:hypothetical protein